ncbi:sulfite exporter TauE/SafE family protein [Proteus myxofaciens]|uniref:Probable membrane transporter protein n=1 Tax=Proteus myxofaciens ATCC 19692 TaxID=1354337 RepID=A0A198FR38_9GAMM|nr:sulfite exporter TauE/SafE family protein [Proteus myxofaciens]OAT26924.1 putative membrane protein [Proteus myxofaciens ATCC 19692]
MVELLSWTELIICLLTLFFAYIIFGMAGFGSALIAGPVLAIYLPLPMVVPLLALIDLSAAIVNMIRDGKKAEFKEIRYLIPLIITGSLVGAFVLLTTRPDILSLLLGLFAVFYALYALFWQKKSSHFSQYLVYPFGLIGGVFSALFGSGGFLYAIYLSGRIEDKNSFRVTQTTLIGFSTLIRVIIFLFVGIYWQLDILQLAIVFLPAMFAGVWIGRNLTLRMSKARFMNVIYTIVLISGSLLIYRYFS